MQMIQLFPVSSTQLRLFIQQFPKAPERISFFHSPQQFDHKTICLNHILQHKGFGPIFDKLSSALDLLMRMMELTQCSNVPSNAAADKGNTAMQTWPNQINNLTDWIDKKRSIRNMFCHTLGQILLLHALTKNHC